MKTQRFCAINQKENGTKIAGAAIRSGALVAFPTETVYGLGANGLCAEAVARIYAAKGRPADNPLILHVAKKSDVRDLWTRVPETARKLMDAFWPGPLTLIYYRSDLVPDAVSAGLDTVAVRMPEHKTALALIRAAGVPIAAPSANRSGRPSPTTAEHVLKDLDGRIEYLLDGGPCRVGVESTVLSLSATPPCILRPGGITRGMLEAVIGPVEIARSVLGPMAPGETAASPGMKYKHYAPDAKVLVAEGSPREMAGRILREYERQQAAGKTCVIFATKQTQSLYRGKKYDIIGDRESEQTLLKNLFAALRRYSGEVDVILAESLPETGFGLAYMNRLLRAAGFERIEP